MTDSSPDIGRDVGVASMGSTEELPLNARPSRKRSSRGAIDGTADL